MEFAAATIDTTIEAAVVAAADYGGCAAIATMTENIIVAIMEATVIAMKEA